LMVVSWVPMAMRMVSALADRVNEASRQTGQCCTRMGVSLESLIGSSSPPRSGRGGKRGASVFPASGVGWLMGCHRSLGAASCCDLFEGFCSSMRRRP
jgi:hypothetical protein